MTPEPTTALLICHATAAEAAAQAVRSLSPALEIDLLCYGRTSDEHPPPPGTRLVGPAVQESASKLESARRILALRHSDYDLVALSQPSLALSRARGLLIAAAHAVSGGRAVILDPAAARVVRPITSPLVIVELIRWLTLHVAARVLAGAGAAVIDRLAERAATATAPGGDGDVVYLRTDIDLRIGPLAAGGSVAHTEGVLQALLDRGHDVSYWGTGEVAGIPTEVPRRRLPALLKGNFPTEVAELVSGVLQGIGANRANGTAFVYQRYSLNNLSGAILARRRGVPLVLEANGSEAKWRQDFGTLTYPRLAYATERLLLRRSDVIAAVSRNAAEDLINSGAPPERVRVVPNGVSVARFRDAEPMPLPEGISGGFVVCFVGLFYPWHGIRFLAEAFAILHERAPDARLLLVGDGEDAPVARAILERRGALGAAHFTGLVPRPKAPRYMAAADVLVSPHADVHRFIGSPIKLFEYMAAGRPIVATRVGQIPEILADELTALLVAPEDPGAMAAAIERLHGDRELGRRLGTAAQREAAEHHSWDARLASLLDGSA